MFSLKAEISTLLYHNDTSCVEWVSVDTETSGENRTRLRRPFTDTIWGISFRGIDMQSFSDGGFVVVVLSSVLSWRHIVLNRACAEKTACNEKNEVPNKFGLEMILGCDQEQLRTRDSNVCILPYRLTDEWRMTKSDSMKWVTSTIANPKIYPFSYTSPNLHYIISEIGIWHL